MGPAVAVVIVTYDSADAIGGTLAALAPQLAPGDEVVVVDNASRDGTAAAARAARPEAVVVETGANLGFAAGVHAGARASSAPLLLLLNPDCLPGPGMVDALRATAAERPGWAAWQALVTLPGGERVNSAGNLVHFLGIGWAGGLEQPVATVPAEPHEVGFASGAAMVVRRTAWDAARGFDPHYFMYGEDLDLALRLRLAGHGVGIVPAARVEHDYAFVKGDYKWFHLERNRWWTVLSVYPAPLLAVLAPALAAFELALLPAAWRGGWLRAKLRAQAAGVRELRAIGRRRRRVQATRRIGARAFADGLTASLDSPVLAGAAAAGPPLAAYWRVATALLGPPGRGPERV